MYSNQNFYTYNPYYNDYYRAINNTKLVSDIQKAINGEASAIECYDKIAKMAPIQSEKNQILEIRKDEVRHLEQFSRIYTNLTGRQPTSQILEKCPNTFSKGLEFAFRDEQKTVDFYLDIADRAQDSSIKESFHRAAADEQSHAVWFLFFLQKMQR